MGSCQVLDAVISNNDVLMLRAARCARWPVDAATHLCPGLLEGAQVDEGPGGGVDPEHVLVAVCQQICLRPLKRVEGEVAGPEKAPALEKNSTRF